MDVPEEKGPLLPRSTPAEVVHLRVDVAVGDKQIEPSVVVDVQKARAPAEKGDGRLRDAHLVAYVSEVGVAIVAVERAVGDGEGGVIEIDEAIVGIVARGDSHAGSLAAALVQSIAAGGAGILEGAVALVEIKIVWRRVVGHQQVRTAVAIDIDEQ